MSCPVHRSAAILRSTDELVVLNPLTAGAAYIRVFIFY